jgi:hypothetical protein
VHIRSKERSRWFPIKARAPRTRQGRKDPKHRDYGNSDHKGKDLKEYKNSHEFEYNIKDLDNISLQDIGKGEESRWTLVSSKRNGTTAHARKKQVMLDKVTTNQTRTS